MTFKEHKYDPFVFLFEYLQFWEVSLIVGHASWLKEGNDE